MLLGLISDTHDNAPRTRKALALLQDAGAGHLLHAGDLQSGALVPYFEGFQVHLARGNVDASGSIREAIQETGAPIQYATLHELDLAGMRVGVIHGDDGARLEGMINSGAFDVIVHGHTHTFRDIRVGETRVINPGAVHRSSEPSVATYDTETGTLDRIFLT
ncbi:MAG: YfcE family phosphodiesterase [Candidatus Thermoplasmatota archaeon]|nr:YfcE family phosphodiesterase [Candidatus Thermoplasmatota archaeon]